MRGFICAKYTIAHLHKTKHTSMNFNLTGLCWLFELCYIFIGRLSSAQKRLKPAHFFSKLNEKYICHKNAHFLNIFNMNVPVNDVNLGLERLRLNGLLFGLSLINNNSWAWLKWASLIRLKFGSFTNSGSSAQLVYKQAGFEKLPWSCELLFD